MKQSLPWHQIKCLILDVDGICTEGSLFYNSKGEELKQFNVLDGHGIKMLIKQNIHVAIISGRYSPIVTLRFNELGVEHIYQSQHDKYPAYAEILKKLNLNNSQVAYMGDDTPDIPLLKQSIIGISVPNAHPEAIAQCQYMCKRSGGNGAVREVADLILNYGNIT